MTIDIIWV